MHDYGKVNGSEIDSQIPILHSDCCRVEAHMGRCSFLAVIFLGFALRRARIDSDMHGPGEENESATGTKMRVWNFLRPARSPVSVETTLVKKYLTSGMHSVTALSPNFRPLS